MKAFLLIILINIGLLANALPKGAVQENLEDMAFKTAKKPFPPVPMVILEGDPLKEGIYTFRIKVAPFKKIPQHWHLKDERVTVLEGEICVGFSETVDYTQGNCIQAGGFYINPKEVKHYLWTKEKATVLQVTGEGPWGMKFK